MIKIVSLLYFKRIIRLFKRVFKILSFQSKTKLSLSKKILEVCKVLSLMGIIGIFIYQRYLDVKLW